MALGRVVQCIAGLLMLQEMHNREKGFGISEVLHLMAGELASGNQLLY